MSWDHFRKFLTPKNALLSWANSPKLNSSNARCHPLFRCTAGVVSTLPLEQTSLTWDPFEEQLFKIRLSSPKASEVIKEIFTSPIHDAGDIDQYIEKINQILLGAASVRTKYKKKTTRIHKKKHTKARTSKQWYDGELYRLRQQLLTLGNSLLHDPKNSYLRGKFFLLKKYYKKEVQQKKEIF